ncbi:MAG TPA: site-specific integrase [Pseudolabrys sp.]|nr:site-specific integrase [Pseudolabrys sp.]
MPLKLYRRGKVWHYRGTVAGQRLRGSCKTADQALAARTAAKIETAEWKCHFDGPQAVLTFAQAAGLYKSSGKPTRFLDRIEDHWKDTLVKDIKASGIRQMAIVLYPKASNATRNRQAIIPCQAVINYAADSELCPHVRVKRFKVEKKIRPPFTLEWVDAFCRHAPPHLEALVLFIFATGARISEALAVQWEHVDLSARTILIPRSKLAEQRIVHLPGRVVAAIANLPRTSHRPVFFYRRRCDFHNKWNAVIKAAAIKRMTPHSGRHGFATTALKKMDPKTAAWLGGWKNIRLFMETYAHAIEDITLNERVFDAELTQSKPANQRKPRKTGTT